MSEPQTEVSADTPIGKFKAAGKDVNTLATIITLILVCLVAWIIWEHKADAKTTGTDLTMAINAMTKAQQEATAAHRETNCLIGIPEAQRESKAEFCKRISR